MARVDYDRMAPDYVRGRVLPEEGMEAWRAAIEPWVPDVPAGRWPVLDLGPGRGRVLRPGAVVLVRQAFPGRMERITLYERFFPGRGPGWPLGCPASSARRRRSRPPASGRRRCGRWPR